MNTVVLACQNLSEEIGLVLKKNPAPYPVIWVEPGLHGYPEKRRARLQEAIDRVANVDRILFLFGCGKALAGLNARQSQLVLPKVEDCAALLLGGNGTRLALSRRAASYYLTRGMLTYEDNLWDEFFRCVEKYGFEKARKIYRIMLETYRSIRVIDTGTYKVEELLAKTKKLAGEFNLDHEVVKGSLQLLEKAFQGRLDRDFAVVEPGGSVSLKDLGLIEALDAGQSGFERAKP